jgi:hypothetical protein
MKLELKDLAPYLTYGLKYVKYSDNNSPIRHDIMQGVSTNGIYACGDITPLSFKNCKPILRPLSDLTTSHNIFEDKAICFIDESDNGGSFTIDDIYFKYKESSFSDWRNAYLLLLKHHFDVFGLIEKGLAIDINTLEQ